MRLVPSPAVVGAVAIAAAATGVFVGPETGVADSPAQTRVVSLGYSGNDASDAVLQRRSEPRVSRGQVDRAVLQRQAKQQAKQRAKALAVQAADTQQHADKLQRQKAEREARRARQWVLPVAGYHLTARFGQSSGLWSSVHTGLDFAAAPGTQIASVARGTVTEVGFDGAYGNKTVITLEDGTEIWYCHQSSTQVSVGQQVDPGDPIGQVGATGNVTGPHLHLEVRPGGGDPVDPYNVLVEHHVKP